MKHVLAVLLFFLAMSMPLFAQTTYNLPDAYCSIQGSGYLFCSDMANITINGVLYGVDSVAQIPQLYNYPASGPVVSGDVELEDWSTGIYTTGWDTTTSTYTNYVLTQNFSGDLNGSLTFTLIRKKPAPPCGRYCYIWHYYAHNVVLTVQ